MSFLLALLQIVGSVLLTTAAISFLAKRWVGGWIDSRFELRLERFKSEQATQLEHVRQELSNLSNRLSKIHEKEFEVLPEVWSKLHDAMARTRVLISPMRDNPDLDGMPPELLQEFIDGLGLDWTRWEKGEIAAASNKKQKYMDLRVWRELSAASEAHSLFHNYAVRNKFLLGDLHDPIFALSTIIHQTQFRARMNADAKKQGGSPLPDLPEWKDVEPLVVKVDALIQKRLLAQG